MHGVEVNEVLKPAVMGGAYHVVCMEGALHVASRSGHGTPDGLESATEGIVGADEMSMVHAHG